MAKQELVRRSVGKQLAAYYAQPANLVVGTSAGVGDSNLSSLLGEWHWKRVFRKLYEEREGHWLTPVELFRPHYSHIVADFCAFATKDVSCRRIDIVELGGGRGTNANLILSYLRDTKPEVYSKLTYTLVDSSPSLHRLQREALALSDHGERVKFAQKDLMDVAEARTSLLSKSDTPTLVIGMEVLDNLPHDKVRAKSRKKLEQAEVRTTETGGKEEVFVPLMDPLLTNVLKRVPSYVKTTMSPVWVPSVACGVLRHLLKQRPNLSLAFADFDWLPPPDLELANETSSSYWAHGEPIITDMDGTDHLCYLNAPPHCDVLFPTDFQQLASFLKRSIADRENWTVKVLKQGDFLQTFGPSHVQATKSWLTGHTPLLHDFSNCSVLTLTTQQR